MKRRSSALIGWGTALVSLGITATIAGPALFAGSAPPLCFDCGVLPMADAGGRAGGVALMVVGATFLAAGIPMIIVGAQNVPDRDEESVLMPTVRVGAASVSLSF
jgi:hypothetical protein